jgi:hypothetical protein
MTPSSGQNPSLGTGVERPRSVHRRRGEGVKSTPEQTFGAVQKIKQTVRKPGVSRYMAA